MTDFSEKVEKTHIAYIHETLGQSVARDLSTALTFLALWSFGHFVGSPALEWIGVLLGLLILFGRLISLAKSAIDKRMTPDEARAWLDERFPR